MLIRMRVRSLRVGVLGALSALAAATMAVVACVGDDPAAGGDTSGTDGGGSASGDGASGGDGAIGADSGVCGTCSDPTTLARCDGTTETCTFGCEPSGGAHCRAVYPSKPVLPDDLRTPGVLPITFADAKLVTDTGEITDLRPANTDPLLMEVKDGIGFRLADDGNGHKLAIWIFESVTVPDGVTLTFTSTNPAALVAAKTISVAGTIDARGYDGSGALCAGGAAGPGGFLGGASMPGPFAGGGPGGGQPPAPIADYSGGAGGGGHGGTGGRGGPGTDAGALEGGVGGVAYGAPDVLPLVGGSGGGATKQGSGGGGGGAIQLVAPETITIGGGASLGGVNAGGCNGSGGGFGNSAGAGGAGGTILIETRTLTMSPNGRLAACGGGGGSGSTAGMPAKLDGPGGGAGAAAGYGFGGTGGCFSPPNGGGGASASTYSGGSAGGGSGRIRINNRTGSLQPPANAILPPLGISPLPPTTVGTLDIH